MGDRHLNFHGDRDTLALRYFALIGTDHHTHAEQDTAIGDYIRWHNQRARPKTGYATNSKIRHPDYPFKAA